MKRVQKLAALSLALAASSSTTLWSADAHADAFEHHHALGTGYQFTHVSADSGGSYNVHSLPVNYVGRYGPRLAGLFRFSALVPLLAQQGDTAFFPGEHYDTYGGFDMFLGPAYRFLELPKWDMDIAFGGHMNYIRFTSDHFVEWSTATAGFGIASAGRHQFSGRFWGGQPEIGVHGDVTFDVADFSRNGDLQVGFQVQLGVSIGMEWGEKRRLAAAAAREKALAEAAAEAQKEAEAEAEEAAAAAQASAESEAASAESDVEAEAPIESETEVDAEADVDAPSESETEADASAETEDATESEVPPEAEPSLAAPEAAQ